MSQQYRVTFGQQYGREGEPPHPRLAMAHRDGWVTIVANNYEQARQVAFAVLGNAWAELYGAPDRRRDDWRATFPRGELLRIVAPGRQHPPSDEDAETWAGWLEHAEDLTATLERYSQWGEVHGRWQGTETAAEHVHRWLLADQHDEIYGPDHDDGPMASRIGTAQFETGPAEKDPPHCPNPVGGRCGCPDEGHTP